MFGVRNSPLRQLPVRNRSRSWRDVARPCSGRSSMVSQCSACFEQPVELVRLLLLLVLSDVVAVDPTISDEPEPCGCAGACSHLRSHPSAGPAMNESTASATSPWRSSRIAVIGVFSLRCGFPPINH